MTSSNYFFAAAREVNKLPLLSQRDHHRDGRRHVQDALSPPQLQNEVQYLDIDRFFFPCAQKVFLSRLVPNREYMIYATYIPSNDTWLGLVGMLQRADGDWAFPTISVTAERLTVVDYATVTTVPLTSVWETNSFKKCFFPVALCP